MCLLRGTISIFKSNSGETKVFNGSRVIALEVI